MATSILLSIYTQRLIEMLPSKYSYRASLKVIAENDFNLNIQRYVDTFEEEEEIDLLAVVTELRELEQGMDETERIIRSFCDELGIEVPL